MIHLCLTYGLSAFPLQQFCSKHMRVTAPDPSPQLHCLLSLSMLGFLWHSPKGYQLEPNQPFWHKCKPGNTSELTTHEAWNDNEQREPMVKHALLLRRQSYAASGGSGLSPMPTANTSSIMCPDTGFLSFLMSLSPVSHFCSPGSLP